MRFKLDWASLIECFHSRGQHLCKFIGTKESVCIRKEFNSHRTGLGHQHGHRFIVLGHQYGRHDIMRKHSIVGRKFTVFAHLEGRINSAFFGLPVWGGGKGIFGGAYTYRGFFLQNFF